jgi:hypothetical protein
MKVEEPLKTEFMFALRLPMKRAMLYVACSRAASSNGCFPIARQGFKPLPKDND